MHMVHQKCVPIKHLLNDRQDRYVLVENCPGLADYYESYIDSIGKLQQNLLSRWSEVWLDG